MDTEAGLSRSDQRRMTGGALPESMIAKERLDHLRSAFDELPDVQARVLVMRDVDGLSYREIGERLACAAPRWSRRWWAPGSASRASTSSSRRAGAASRFARQSRGSRMARAARGDEYRLARHAKRCSTCRRLARGWGRSRSLTPLRRSSPRCRCPGASARAGVVPALGGLASERAAALVAAVAIAGAGGAASR